MTDSKIEKWQRWAEGPIRDEILGMHLQRATFREIFEIAQKAELPPSYFWEYLRDTYATTLALGIRRQAEVDPRVVSLAMLISEIRDNASRITRGFFCELFDTDDAYWQRTANQQFDDQLAGEDDSDQLDPAIPARDLSTLTEHAASVKTYVDEHLAHADAKREDPSASYDDIDAALDTIGDMFRKYAGFLSALTYVQLEPVIQHNWKAIFRQPWLPERGPGPSGHTPDG